MEYREYRLLKKVDYLVSRSNELAYREIVCLKVKKHILSMKEIL